MTKLIVVVPNVLPNAQGRLNDANEYLRDENHCRIELRCRTFGDLNNWLSHRKVKTGDWLRRLPNSYHLLEPFDGDIFAAMARVLRFHNDSSGRTPGHGWVERIEPDRLLFSSASPILADLGKNFTLGGKHADYRNQMLDIRGARQQGTGKDKRIAIVDSGLEATSSVPYASFHDLLIDPPSTPNAPPATQPIDESGHGTAMATIIHDCLRDDTTSSQAIDAELHIIRVFDSGSAELWPVMAGLATAVATCKADLINLSLGFPDIPQCHICGVRGQNRAQVFKQFMADLSELYLQPKGPPPRPIYVVATGNDGRDVGVDQPAAYDFKNQLAVGAINSKPERAQFSNYDLNQANARYLVMPGGDDQKDAAGLPIEHVGYADDVSSIRHYCYGTSPATAYATALLALYWSIPSYSQKTPDELLDELLKHKCETWTGHDLVEHGAGYLKYK